MSSKKKSGKSDWSRCQSCKLLVTNKDWSLHVYDCRKRNTHDGSFLNESVGSNIDDKDPIKYGFIQNNMLHALVCLPTEKGSEKLMPSSHGDLIHLNPDTMQICGLHIGRPVFIQTCPPTRTVPFVCTAWPVPNFPAALGGLPASLQEGNHLHGGDVIRVKPIECPIVAAKVVSFLCSKHLINSSFKAYLINSVKNKLILPGNKLNLNYFGKPCQLKVWSITGIDGKEIVCKQSQIATESQDSIFDQSESRSLISDSSAGRSSSEKSSTSKLRTFDDHGDSSGDGKSSNTKSNISDSPNRSSSICGAKSETHSSPFVSKTQVTSTPKRTNLSAGTGGDGDNELEENLSLSLKNLKLSTSPHDSSSLNEVLGCSDPQTVFKLTSTTDIVLVSSLDSNNSTNQIEGILGSVVTYDMIGGLKRQLKTIKETLEVPLTNPDLFTSLGIVPPRGVLLYGPPGVGKTMIAKAVAHEAGAHVIVVNGPEVMSKYYGESEAKLRSIFQEGCRNAPCLIFIDELDALCPKREQVQSELEKRLVATLLTLMDGIGSMSSKGHVMILGATNRPDAIDAALRRPGRFDREIEIGVPNADDRKDILEKCLSTIQHQLSPDDVQHVADAAHGYVGADLAAVCKEAALHAFEQQKGNLSDSRLEGKVHVTSADFLWALKEVRPSAMREVEIDVPKVYWSDIGGLETIKLKLKQAVEWPIKHPEAFQRMGITPPRGILMYGPPGCSKTLIAKALATESGLNFIAVKGPELFNKWVGESERAVREVFRKARLASPSIVFFDEIDALAVERGNSSGGTNVGDRVLGQLLTEIDGVEGLQDVTVVAATNRPDIIDKALMRPGRLDRILFVSLPDALTRKEIFAIQFRHMPINSDVDLEELVENTDNYSGAEVVAVCREAGLAAMQESIDIEHVSKRHFDEAFSSVKPRTTLESIKYYDEYQQTCGLHSI